MSIFHSSVTLRRGPHSAKMVNAVLTLSTLNDVFFALAGSGRKRAMLFEDAAGEWQPISSAQAYQRVRAVAAALRAWGIDQGERVAILAENRWEWAVADFACLALGVVDVPIYPTLLAEQIAPLLTDSGAKAIFVSTRAQYEKIAALRTGTALERVVVMDELNVPGAVTFSSLVAGADQGASRDAEFDAAARAVRPEELATLIYTSGTTGEPKGVRLTHGNIASNVNYSTAEFGFTPTDSCISFLPLSHITARHLDYALYAQSVTIAYCPAFDKLPQTMQAIQPTIFVAVPRVYEKVRQVAEQKSVESAVKRRLFGTAIGIGKPHAEEIAAGKTPSSFGWTLADRLVYSKIRAGFGGRVRYFIAGGAPLGLDTARWFAVMGIRILEGYGLTETAPVLAINTPRANRMGSVGRPLPNVEYQFAEDGELLVRGPNVFSGYWKQEARADEPNVSDTSAAFDAEGWFRTGDIGHVDADGFLYITDRKKELLKTSGGKLIAPQPIENKLKASYLVANAALVGDRHKFASALIAPNFAALEAWAKEHGVAAVSRQELAANAKVRAEYQALVDKVNATLANFETVKRFRLVADEWAIDSGELTPSMKLRRRVIARKYTAEIAEFYADEATSSRRGPP